MTCEYAGVTFEAEPSRPAPGPNKAPSPKVLDKLDEMLPKIIEVRDSTTSQTSPDSES